MRFWLMVAILAVGGTGLRLLSHGETTLIERPLSTLPLKLGDWQGWDVAIEPRLVKAAAVDDYLNRDYRNTDHRSLLLYVGYYRSQRTGRWVHSPKNCLPGAGWEPTSAGRMALALPSGERILVNRYIVQKGLDRLLVLYWYQSHGRVVASEYWGKIYLVLDALRLHRTDVALVRISIAIPREQTETADRTVGAFTEVVMPQLQALLPQ